MKMPFGKHKGEDLDDVPVDYLGWLLANTDIDKRNPELAEEAQAQLDAREGRGILRRPRRCAVHVHDVAPSTTSRRIGGDDA